MTGSDNNTQGIIRYLFYLNVHLPVFIDHGFRLVRMYDSGENTRLTLGIEPAQAHACMLFDGRYKYIHYEGFRPQLFDLETDPREFADLGEDPACAEIRDRMHERLKYEESHDRHG